MFLNGLSETVSLKSLLESNDAYSIISENINLLKKLEESPEVELVFTEAEMGHAEKAAEEYITEVRGKVEKYTDKADKLRHESQIWAWLGLGVYILGMLLAATAEISLVLGVLGVIGLLVSIAFFIVAAVKGDKARKEVQKLIAIREKLKVHRSRTDNHRVQDKIDDILFRIQQAEAGVYDDTSERTTSYNMN